MECCNGLQQATVTEIAEELQVHKSTASRLLAVLEQHRLVSPAARLACAYELGHGILQHGQLQCGRNATAPRSAQLLVEAWLEHFSLTANVAILDDTSAVNIAQSDPPDKFFTPRQYVGRRTPGHATSSGKVLLAFADQQIRDRISIESLDSLYPNIPSLIPALMSSELDRVQQQRWAVSNNEWDADMTAIGVPLLGSQDRVVAAVTVTGFTHDLPPETFAVRAEELQTVVAQHGRLLD